MPDALGLTEAEAARAIGVCERTLRRWRKRGAIGYVLTPGGRVRYVMENLHRLQADMIVPPSLGVSKHVRISPAN